MSGFLLFTQLVLLYNSFINFSPADVLCNPRGLVYVWHRPQGVGEWLLVVDVMTTKRSAGISRALHRLGRNFDSLN